MLSVRSSSSTCPRSAPRSRPCGELESTKSVSDLVSPVSGTVAAVNDAVVDEPGTINEDPYGAGWLFTVTVSAEGDLLSAQDYADKFDAVVDG